MTRVAVTGATGNVGWAVVRALAADDDVDEIIGIARRTPEIRLPNVTWASADIRDVPLAPLLRDVDCVVHLAWALQSSHDRDHLESVNVDGSHRVFEVAAAAGVSSLVYASSVGAYSPGPKTRRVDESWPTDGIEGSTYSDQKSRVEQILDRFEDEHRDIRTVRLRKALVFQRDAASEIARLFLGRLGFVASHLGADRIPVVPRLAGLVFQAVHSDDVGDAYRRAVLDDSAHGAYNVAADPVLDAGTLSKILSARSVPSPPPALAHAATALLWHARLLAAEPGWIDLALNAPVMRTSRIRGELGWAPSHDAGDALRELLDGFRDGAGAPTPPLCAREAVHEGPQ